MEIQPLVIHFPIFRLITLPKINQLEEFIFYGIPGCFYIIHTFRERSYLFRKVNIEPCSFIQPTGSGDQSFMVFHYFLGYG